MTTMTKDFVKAFLTGSSLAALTVAMVYNGIKKAERERAEKKIAEQVAEARAYYQGLLVEVEKPDPLAVEEPMAEENTEAAEEGAPVNYASLAAEYSDITAKIERPVIQEISYVEYMRSTWEGYESLELRYSSIDQRYFDSDEGDEFVLFELPELDDHDVAFFVVGQGGKKILVQVEVV